MNTAVCLYLLSPHAELIIYSNVALVNPVDIDLTVSLQTQFDSVQQKQVFDFYRKCHCVMDYISVIT